MHPALSLSVRQKKHWTVALPQAELAVAEKLTCTLVPAYTLVESSMFNGCYDFFLVHCVELLLIATSLIDLSLIANSTHLLS